LVGNGFELVFAARAEHDFRAFAGKFECGGFADAAGRAGDNDDFVGDVLHRSCSCLCWFYGFFKVFKKFF